MIKWSWEVSAGQAINGALITVGGLWFAFSLLSGYDRSIINAKNDASARISALEEKVHLQEVSLSSRIALIDQSNAARVNDSTAWRANVTKQLDTMTGKMEQTNTTLSQIQLSLANKVDRKP